MQHGKGGQCYIMALLVIAFILLGFLSQGEAGQSIVVYNPAGERADGVYVDQVLKQTMQETGVTRPPLAGKFRGRKTERVWIRKDTEEEVNAWFYQHGWTDGLPIVPPTIPRVKKMLTGTDLPQAWLLPLWNPCMVRPR